MTEDKNTLFGEFVLLDQRARALLGEFYGWLKSQEGTGLPAEEASALAHHADRYLRDFLVDILETEPEKSSLAAVRSYLGNWYIINTLEPTFAQMEEIAKALLLYHRWANLKGLVDMATLGEVEKALLDKKFFTGRLESFWELDEKGITAWREVDDYRRPSRLQ